MIAGWLLFGTANVAEYEIAEQPEDDEEAEQNECVYPQRGVAALLGQNGVHRYDGRFARCANSELALRTASEEEKQINK